MKLTQKTIAALPLVEDRGKADVIYFDNALAGFGIRFRDSRGTWIAQFRVGRKQRRMTLGPIDKVPHDMARAKAKTLLAQAALGEDPQAKRIEKQAKASTILGGVIEDYLAAKAPGLRHNTIRGNEYYLRRLWAPLHKLPISDIDRADVAARIRKLTEENGATTATRARAALSAVFAWALREGIPIEQGNIVVHTNTPAQSEARARVLADQEIRDVWSACGEAFSYGRIIRLCLCLGCRRQEVGSMRWSEIQDDIWIIPGSRTKNHREHRLPILGFAAEIIEDTPRVAGRDLLFGQGGNGFTGWSTGWTTLAECINSIRKAQGIDPMPHWTAHDLRRTVATRMADLGVEPHHIEAALNHQSGHRRGIAGVYNRSRYESAIRSAFTRWDYALRAIVSGEMQNVVPAASRIEHARRG
jgi:integrase